METVYKQVKSSLFEIQNYILKEIDYTIKQRSTLHITAPVGTHKTSLALKLIEKYPNKQLLFLMPQTSISQQVFNKLAAKKVPAFIFNSNTRANLKLWELQKKHSWKNTYLSTIDSAYRLFEEGKLDPKNTIVIIDETHSFLQNPRKDFDPTIHTIKQAGCPVIGFTATESTWVLEYILGVNKAIRIDASELPKKRIVPIKVGNGLPATIADYIVENNWKKVVIWTEHIKDQNRISEEILKLAPNKKVVVLNRPRRENEEKVSWDHLMQDDEISPNTEILIVNSIAQAGININDEDIDAVLLAGQFDPIGFAQYLGRCRNYDRYFYFFYQGYGEQKSRWPGAKKMEDYLAYIQGILDNYSDEEFTALHEINPLIEDYYMQSENGKFLLKKCMVANKVYESFRKVNGEEMLQVAATLDQSIDICDKIEESGVRQQSESKLKAIYRRRKKAELPELIKKDARYLMSMIQFYTDGMTHDYLLKLITNSSPDKKYANANRLLYVPRTFKNRLLDTVKTAKNANVGVNQLLLSAKKYVDLGKDGRAMKSVLNMSSQQVGRLIAALSFFHKRSPSKPRIRKVLTEFSGRIGECKPAKAWVNEIQNSLTGIPGFRSVAISIYESCFITTRNKYNENGKRKNGQRLKRIVKSFDEYLKYNGLDKIFKSVS